MTDALIGLDIETIPSEDALKTDAWKRYKDGHGCNDDYAALHPAFAQIVAVALIFRGHEDTKHRITHVGMDERRILEDVRENMAWACKNRNCYRLEGYLVGHCIRNFDMPMLTARYIRHGLKVPTVFKTINKDPWELSWVRDTSDYVKNNGKLISLDTLCLLCSVSSPKTDNMDGKRVWEEAKAGNLSRVGDYCLDDVRAVLDCYDVLIACTGD